MNSLFIIAFRRLRAPLILIIVIFAIATAGLALVPGVDGDGRPAYLSLFQAFYVVSYTATTIGFGEIPYAFTDHQRLWVVVIIYLSVVGWTYLLGGILSLSTDKGFRYALAAARFRGIVRRLHEPFFVVCGIGTTGLSIARSLDRLNFRFVALDVNERRIQELDLEDLMTDPPALVADARSPETLIMAGLLKPQCRGVLALSNDDNTNLAIAIAVKLLHPGLRIICHCHTAETAASMTTVGAYRVINSFHEFSDRLVLAMRAPNTYRLLSWLTGLPGTSLSPRIPAPPGRWIICGYGRFGTEVSASLRRAGFDVKIIDPRTAQSGDLPVVCGRGTNVGALRAAGIEDAVGIVAGTDDDTANLAIAIASRQLKPSLFLVLRQNLVSNQLLFEASKADMTMVSNQIIANECVAILRTRLLAEFLAIARERDDGWADAIVEQLRSIVGEKVPQFWSFVVSVEETPGLVDAMNRSNRSIVLADLLRDISERERPSMSLVLLLNRAGDAMDLPNVEMALQLGDQILCAGTSEAERDLVHLLRNANVAQYVISGCGGSGGLV